MVKIQLYLQKLLIQAFKICVHITFGISRLKWYISKQITIQLVVGMLFKKNAFQNAGWSNSHFLHKQNEIRNSLNHFRLKQSKVLTLNLKHDGIQYLASVQFCPGYYSSEVVNLLSHPRSLTSKIIPRIEI